MSDDIEALRNICNQVMDDEPRKQAITALERLAADRDALRKALDDRYAADQKAAKAIFAETGRTSGFPSVKEVVAWHVAEVERLEKVLAGINVHRNALLRQTDSLRAKLERAKEVAKEAIDEYEDNSHYKSEYLQEKHGDVAEIARLRAVLSELSADAPAQQTQISEEVREAMVEAEKALEPFAAFSYALLEWRDRFGLFQSKWPNNVPVLDRSHPTEGHVGMITRVCIFTGHFIDARIALAKLRSVQ